MKKQPKLPEIAYTSLKKMIVSGEMEENTVYSETKLAKQFAISRTPMRNALGRLQDEGFVEIIPNIGFKIKALTAFDINEVYTVRSALEGYVAYLLARTPDSERSKQIILRMEEIISAQWDAQRSGDIASFASLDHQFHIALVGHTDNIQINDIFYNNLLKVKSLALSSLRHEGRMTQAVKSHEEIVTAIKNGIPDIVYELILSHLSEPRDSFRHDINSKNIKTF